MNNRRLEIGSDVSLPSLEGVNGVKVVPGTGVIHLQFRRFAGCPICNLHLRSFERRAQDLREADVQELVVFHSSAAQLMPYVSQLPFAVIADPHKQLYQRFGVEAARRALSDPRVWLSILRAIGFATYQKLVHGVPTPDLMPSGGRWGLPADFLLSHDGEVLALKYGEHADDQWSVEDVLAHAAEQPQPLDAVGT
jgi:peroxiredoxin